MPTANSLTADQLTTPFIDSTQNVFSMMLGCSVDLIDAAQYDATHSDFDLSGIIGFTGSLRGTIAISFDQNVGFSIAETLLGVRPSKIDNDVRDIVGELANMIGGNAKERLNSPDIFLGLPTVVSGHGHEISLDPDAEVHQLYFSTPWGVLAIKVALRQVQ